MLPVATKNDIGGVKVGDGLTVDDDGTLHAGDGGLRMVVTYGSPKTNSSINGWVPSNIVSIYGPPNLRVFLTVDNGATLLDHDANADNRKTLTLGSDGQAQNDVLVSTTNNTWMTSVLLAPFSQNGGVGQKVLTPVAKAIAFYPMDSDTSWTLLREYGYTRDVPSDGATPCLISVHVNAQAAQAANVSTLTMEVVDGDAVFHVNGPSKTATPPIAANGMVVAELYSAQPGLSTVRISVPNGAAADVAHVYASFVSVPATLTPPTLPSGNVTLQVNGDQYYWSRSEDILSPALIGASIKVNTDDRTWFVLEPVDENTVRIRMADQDGGCYLQVVEPQQISASVVQEYATIFTFNYVQESVITLQYGAHFVCANSMGSYEGYDLYVNGTDGNDQLAWFTIANAPST